MKVSYLVAAAVLLATPAASQTVSSGIEQWQKGDHAAAVATWTPLAAHGDADASFNLGQAYRHGKGVPVSLPRAQQYLETAARTGHVDAATTLGLLLFENGNRVAAMRWLRQAAAGGEPRAMLLYGTALFNGDGVARDPVRAYALVSRAAAQGVAAAQETLAELDEALPLDDRQKGVALAKTMAASAPAAPTAPTSATRPATKIAVRPAPAAPIAAPSLKVAAPNAPARGNWRIQLGAFGQRATAEALFAKVRGKVGARQSFIVPAGKVVRLQVGPYDSRAAAAAACAALGDGCFPVPAR
jgi:TPR repeat protein